MSTTKTVAVLGPAGTFTHLAAQEYFGEAELRFEGSLYAVFCSVVRGDAHAGVVPIENSTNGTVGQTLDLLLCHNDDVRIAGEVLVPVRHCLAMAKAYSGLDLEIHSHPQALEQCARFISDTYPGANLIETASTAEAMRKVGRSSNPRFAAIGSEFAASLYGLDVIDCDIQDSDNNYTVFFVIGREGELSADADKTTICVDVSDRRDTPGALYRLLRPINDLEVNLSYIQSRPTGAARNAYRFFFTLDGPAQSDRVRLAVQSIREQADVKILGAYRSVQVQG